MRFVEDKVIGEKFYTARKTEDSSSDFVLLRMT